MIIMNACELWTLLLKIRQKLMQLKEGLSARQIDSDCWELQHPTTNNWKGELPGRESAKI